VKEAGRGKERVMTTGSDERVVYCSVRGEVMGESETVRKIQWESRKERDDG